MRARLSGWIVSAHLLAAGVGAHAQAPAAPADQKAYRMNSRRDQARRAEGISWDMGSSGALS